MDNIPNVEEMNTKYGLEAPNIEEESDDHHQQNNLVCL